MDLNKYGFDEKLFKKLQDDYKSGNLDESKNRLQGRIEVPDEYLYNYPAEDSSEFKELYSAGLESLANNEVAVVIVNGGMATRFGGVVKGIVEVFDNMSFLELKLRNIKYAEEKFNTKIPVYIMNSFSTEEKTVNYLEDHNYFGMDKEYIKCFNQFISIRLNTDGSVLDDENKKYYGPGHGDFFYAFRKSGCSGDMLSKGCKYLMYSNVDNLGAVINPAIIGYHITKNFEMTAELAKKYPGDKGGAPAVVDGKLQIVEGFKFPAGFNQDDIIAFNTATYIFSAGIFEKDIEIPWYLVKKKVDGQEVIQFEHLAGDLSIFLNCGYIITEREERFFPIKKPDDLENLREQLKEKLSPVIK